MECSALLMEIRLKTRSALRPPSDNTSPSRNSVPNLASQMRDGIFQHRLNHRLQFARRSADDLKHLRSRVCCLRLERSLVRWQLVEQARILDRDDGLSGKILHQVDLLFGEWACLPPVQNKRRREACLPYYRQRSAGYECQTYRRSFGAWMPER